MDNMPEWLALCHIDSSSQRHIMYANELLGAEESFKIVNAVHVSVQYIARSFRTDILVEMFWEMFCGGICGISGQRVSIYAPSSLSRNHVIVNVVCFFAWRFLALARNPMLSRFIRVSLPSPLIKRHWGLQCQWKGR